MRYIPSKKMDIVIVAGIAKNSIIGTNDGKLPWDIPEDLKWFKELTSTPNTCVLMGRNTWDGLPISKNGEKLPGRKKIVISRMERDSCGKDIRFITSWDKRINNDLYALGLDTVFVIGGLAIYETMMSYATKALITKLDVEPVQGIRYCWVTHKIFLEKDDSVAPIILSDRAKVLTYKKKNNITGLVDISTSDADW